MDKEKEINLNQIVNLDPLTKSIQDLIQEREDLKVKVIELQNTNDRLALRERLYQSELGKTRTALQKLAQAINTTPHTTVNEYQQYYGVGIECPEQ